MVTMKSLAVNIENLCFHYPGNSGVTYDGLNLKIAEGERFGLFGPNGAGKTTLMNLMTGLLVAEKGTVELLGHKIGTKSKAVNKLFGFVPQDFSFYQELSPIENLEFFGAWYGLSRKQIAHRSADLLEILGLTDVSHKAVENFSGGMKRRVNLAIGVIHNPKILFLDEPTVGVDVQTRHAIIDYLKQLNKQGTTLIYTSHQLAEAEGLCEQIALVDKGEIVREGKLDSLLEEYGHQDLEELFLNLTGKDYRN